VEGVFGNRPKRLTSAPSLLARRSASKKFTTISGSSALWIMIWVTSIWSRVLEPIDNPFGPRLLPM
jgi:hypothetical protein